MIFDSKEELYFSWYLDELKDAGYIEKYESQPESYVLSAPLFYEYDKHLKTKTKTIVKKLMQEHIYTADFKIVWSEKARNIFFNTEANRVDLTKAPFIAADGNAVSIVEIKPLFDQNNMTRLFTINQKWLCQRHGIYAQKIIVDKKNGKGLFAETFTPIRYLLTDKSLKPRKLKYTPKILTEYIGLL